MANTQKTVAVVITVFGYRSLFSWPSQWDRNGKRNGGRMVGALVSPSVNKRTKHTFILFPVAVDHNLRLVSVALFYTLFPGAGVGREEPAPLKEARPSQDPG